MEKQYSSMMTKSPTGDLWNHFVGTVCLPSFCPHHLAPSSHNLWLWSGAMLLLLLSHFSRVRLCATPSLGFSRQEHWSGLPFPSPMHESEMWKWSRSVMSDSLWPHGLQPTRLQHPWDFQGKSTGVGCYCLLRGWGYSSSYFERMAG